MQQDTDRITLIEESFDPVVNAVVWRVSTLSGLSFTLRNQPVIHVGDVVEIELRFVKKETADAR